MIHVFISVFRQERKNSSITLFNGQNRTKLENRENTDLLGNRVKMAVFDIQNIKVRSFFKDINLTFCSHVRLTELFHVHSGLKQSKMFYIF